MVMCWPAGSTLALVNEKVTGAALVLKATASLVAILIDTAEQAEPSEPEIKKVLPLPALSTVVAIVNPFACTARAAPVDSCPAPNTNRRAPATSALSAVTHVMVHAPTASVQVAEGATTPCPGFTIAMVTAGFVRATK